jgi:uncharacterized protein YvpB
VKTLVKMITVVLVFSVSLLALIEIKGETMSGKRLHRVFFLESNNDWQTCGLVNCKLMEQESSVGFINFAEPAELTTGVVDAGFPFAQLILSWNASKPDSNGSLEFLVEVSDDSKKWHRFDYQVWGINDYHEHDYEPVKRIDGIGEVKVDYLVLERPMRYSRIMVRAFGNANSESITLSRLAISFSCENASWNDYSRYHGKTESDHFESLKLAVPYYTQRNLPKDLAGNCCSPTSVTMVLNYHGIIVTPETMAHEVYDRRGEMYGNWPHNIAAAYTNGLSKAWVEVHCGFDEIYEEVVSGKPVVISIAYGYDELPRSPIHEAPEGHLIAVVGFDGPNVVICNDPAGHNAEDGIINYPRKELENIWVRHGGVAYHLWPN